MTVLIERAEEEGYDEKMPKSEKVVSRLLFEFI